VQAELRLRRGVRQLKTLWRANRGIKKARPVHGNQATLVQGGAAELTTAPASVPTQIRPSGLGLLAHLGVPEVPREARGQTRSVSIGYHSWHC
jgi:hypothetical protein